MDAAARQRGRPVGEPLLDAGQIKEVARAQMAGLGTAGLSLRGIARTLGVTAPALYNYYPRLEDLITALLVDAFSALAAAMNRAADEALAEAAPEPRIPAAIAAMAIAYRAWAVAHPTEFQLIYGNPIPGYTAPAAITVPLANLPFERLIALFSAGLAAGSLRVPPAYATLPPGVDHHFAQHYGALLSGAQMGLLVSSWSRLHGVVMLELFGHLEPVVGDCAAYCAHEVHAWLAQITVQA